MLIWNHMAIRVTRVTWKGKNSKSTLQLVFLDGQKLGSRISTDKNVLPLTVKSFRNQGRAWDTFDPAEKIHNSS